MRRWADQRSNQELIWVDLVHRSRPCYIRIRLLFWSFVVAFNLVGTTDIIVDYYHAIQADVAAMAGQLGAAYAIPIIYSLS
jgi:hypothetical protein